MSGWGGGVPELPADARAALRRVLELLARDRRAPSSITDPERAWQVHVEDSLAGLGVPELRAATRIADVGSGAGFPGIPLAVALADARVDLIEATGRRCEFIRRAIEAARIDNARVVCERAETWAAPAIAGGGREAYEAVTVRAVGRMSTLAELASPLLVEGGILIAWKGRRDPREEEELERAADRLAMTPVAIARVRPHAGARHRHLHVVRKSGPTPADLPRRPGMAKKRPLGAI